MVAVFEFDALIGEFLPEQETIFSYLKQRLGERVSEVDISQNGNQISFNGQVDDQETLEKLALIAGNVFGIIEVNVDNVLVKQPELPSEYYMIKAGDTLSGIAAEYYGSTIKFSLLYEANLEIILDPELMFPGQVIRIPPMM